MNGDFFFKTALKGASLALLVLLAALVVFLGWQALPALQRYGLPFFRGTAWDPVHENFGALPVVFGTAFSALLATAIAAPISVGVALFITELAPRGLSAAVGFLVQLLAAIPSVVYGLWGIFVLAPWLRSVVEPSLGRMLGFLPFFSGPHYGVGMLAAGVILAIMITPTIATLCVEIFRGVARDQREAALAIGATRWEMMRLSVLPASRRGILGATILGLGRAIGETMAVTMVIGNRAEISASLFAPGQTMASVIANEFAEATAASHVSSLAAVGLALLALTVAVNAAARVLVWGLGSGGDLRA